MLKPRVIDFHPTLHAVLRCKSFNDMSMGFHQMESESESGGGVYRACSINIYGEKQLRALLDTLTEFFEDVGAEKVRRELKQSGAK